MKTTKIKPTESPAAITKSTFILEPLTCPSCISKIEGVLSKKPGISKARVLFNAGKVKVEHDQQISAREIANILEKLGYPLKEPR